MPIARPPRRLLLELGLGLFGAALVVHGRAESLLLTLLHGSRASVVGAWLQPLGVGLGILGSAALLRHRGTGARASGQEYRWGVAWVALLVVELLTLLHFLPPPSPLPGVGLGALGLVVLSPWLAAGGALRRTWDQTPAPRALFALAVGAGGGLASSLSLAALGAPRHFLLAGLLAALASAVTLGGSAGREPKLEAEPLVPLQLGARGRGTALAASMAATSVLLLGDLFTPWVRLPRLYGEAREGVEEASWSAQGPRFVDKAERSAASVHLDGAAEAPLPQASSAPGATPLDLAWVQLPTEAKVLVLEGGVGRELRAARLAGPRPVDLLLPDPGLRAFLGSSRWGAFAGLPLELPGVSSWPSDARTFLAARAGRWAVIASPAALLPSGAPAEDQGLRVDPLGTVEALELALSHLEEEGRLVWERPAPLAASLWSGAQEALRRRGSAAPEAHLLACSATRSAALLIQRRPISKQERKAYGDFCRRRHFPEITFAQTEVPPPTDDRPFHRLSAGHAGAGGIAGFGAVFACVLLGAFVLAGVSRRLAGARSTQAPAPPRAPSRWGALLLGLGGALSLVGLETRALPWMGVPGRATTVVAGAWMLGLGLSPFFVSGLSGQRDAGKALAAVRSLLLTLSPLGLALGLGSLAQATAALDPASRGLVLAGCACLLALPWGLQLARPRASLQATRQVWSAAQLGALCFGWSAGLALGRSVVDLFGAAVALAAGAALALLAVLSEGGPASPSNTDLQSGAQASPGSTP